MMDNQPETETVHELNLLEQIEDDPDVTQASLALQLGVAVGTVNWYLKRLIAKGYVKVKRLQRRKLRYIITPEGIAFRARLTLNYIDTSMRLYRRTRQHVRELLGEVKQAGYHRINIAGEGDIADICRLTCLEQGIAVADVIDGKPANLPVLEVHGLKVHLYYPEILHEA
jgi:DNA-binding MarR family transcriptional regulator